jgi:hypothetical protein
VATVEQVELATLEWVDWLNQVPARSPTIGRSPATGWCHGSAGYVHLWTLADSVVGHGRQLDLAERAARHAWLGRSRTGSSGSARDEECPRYFHQGPRTPRPTAVSDGGAATDLITSGLPGNTGPRLGYQLTALAARCRSA